MRETGPLMKAHRTLTADPAELEALLVKNKDAAALFNESKTMYGSIRDEAPDASVIDKEIVKLNKGLSILSRYANDIQVKLGQ